MRVFERFGFLVQMIIQSYWDSADFFLFFFIWVFLFTVLSHITRIEVSDEDYPAVNNILATLMTAYRNCIGDLVSPAYGAWVDKDGGIVVIYITWIIFFGQTMMMIIVLLNFVISVISESYETVNENKKKYTYQDRASLNLLFYQYKNFIYKIFGWRLKHVKFLLLTQEEKFEVIGQQEEEDENTGLLNKFKRIQKDQLHRMDILV